MEASVTDWAIIVGRLKTLLAVAVLFAASGCSVLTAQDVRVLSADGCVILIEGVSLLQAEIIVKEWSFDDDCSTEIITEKK